MAITNLTVANFKNEVLASDKPVLVDFWAVWCGPCQMMSPVVDMLSEEMPEIKFCKLNVDECMTVAMEYQVANIPTLLVFKNGQVVKKIVGFTPKDEMKAELAGI